MLAVVSRHQPAHGRKISALRILNKLGIGKHVGRPERAVADVIDRIQRRPYVADLSFAGSIVSPGNAGVLQAVGKGPEVETRELARDVSRAVHDLYGAAGTHITTPTRSRRIRRVIGIVDRTSALRRHSVEVVRVTRTFQ